MSTRIIPPSVIDLSLALRLAFVILLLGGCTVYQTAPGVYAPAPPSAFDRAWEAARGAAYDQGVTVTAEDRGQGVILGRKGSFDITISLLTQADGSVRVSIKSKGPEAQDPTLNQRLVASYNRRMGQ
ncbi:MAG: hypothetical protein U1E63_12935 [Burkholderiales bacterium]